MLAEDLGREWEISAILLLWTGQSTSNCFFIDKFAFYFLAVMKWTWHVSCDRKSVLTQMSLAEFSSEGPEKHIMEDVGAKYDWQMRWFLFLLFWERGVYYRIMCVFYFFKSSQEFMAISRYVQLPFFQQTIWFRSEIPEHFITTMEKPIQYENTGYVFKY